MKSLYKALSDFQQEVPNIYKNAKGYGYKFADLGEINDIIKPILKKHGLGYAQPLDGDKIKTIIFHVESGESIESSANIPQGVQLKGMNDFQVLGSGITYLRRYSLSSMLGLITDEDADAAGEQVKKPVGTTREDGHEAEIKARVEARKKEIKELLIKHDYTRPDQMTTFITTVLGKNTIDTLEDADSVEDALNNEE